MASPHLHNPIEWSSNEFSEHREQGGTVSISINQTHCKYCDQPPISLYTHIRRSCSCWTTLFEKGIRRRCVKFEITIHHITNHTRTYMKKWCEQLDTNLLKMCINIQLASLFMRDSPLITKMSVYNFSSYRGRPVRCLHVRSDTLVACFTMIFPKVHFNIKLVDCTFPVR